jgi:hypothetical protein
VEAHIMRRLWIAGLVVTLFATTVLAQNGRGTIGGVLTNENGPLATVEVEARDVTTGAHFSAMTDTSGRYSLAVPAGTYEVSVAPLGFTTDRFAKDNQIVETGRTITLDIALKNGNDAVVGDDAAFLAIRARYLNVKGPLPRTAAGGPDLTGTWQANVDPHPEEAALLPWAAEVMKERIANAFKDLPTSACLPDDPAWTTPLLYKIVQTPTLLVFLTEAEPHYRQIFLDGRDHPKDVDPTWHGHSIGRWEGETLIVDTVGFNDKSWVTVQGLPHTDQMHIVERFHRTDLAHMTHEISVTDPATFMKPLVWRADWQNAPGEEIFESICNENNKYRENIADKQ